MENTSLNGKVFGRLTVIGQAPKDAQGRKMLECVCQCGNAVCKSEYSITHGLIKSCGCLHRENGIKMGADNVTHGVTRNKRKPRLYTVWVNMRSRCLNPNNPGYSYYGGRGITICNEWRNDFAAFRAWAVANGYADEMTIERINVDGDYCPGNCKWIPRGEQNFNKRNTNYYEYRGKKYTIAQIAQMTGISKATIRNRIYLGWSIEDVVNKPLRAW